MTPLELRMQSRNDRLEVVRSKHEALLQERGDGNLSDTDKEQIRLYREETESLIEELEGLSRDKEAHDRAIENSRKLRRAQLDSVGGDEEWVGHRTMAEYARDFILTRDSRVCSQIAAQPARPMSADRTALPQPSWRSSSRRLSSSSSASSNSVAELSWESSERSRRTVG